MLVATGSCKFEAGECYVTVGRYFFTMEGVVTKVELAGLVQMRFSRTWGDMPKMGRSFQNIETL